MNPAPLAPTAKPAPRQPAWRKWLPFAAAVLLVTLIVVGLWPKAVSVEVAQISRGPLIVTVDEEGMTRVRNRYVVSAPVSGQLRRIDWKPGAVVEAGETILAVLENPGADFLDARTQAQAEARVRAAEAARDAATAQRERAAAAARMYAADFERAKTLGDQKVLSAQEFDTARMRSDVAVQDARAAEFGLKVAEFELQQAQAILIRGRSGGSEPLVIRSPVSGRILRVLQESSRVVPSGFALLEVGDPKDLEVRIEVLSRDGVTVRPGARVILEQWGGPQPLNARVRLVEPSAFTKISALGVEEQRVYVVADFTDPVERRETLGDSFRVETRIVTWETEDALRCPTGALFQTRGQWFTYTVEGGRARLRSVNVGRSNGVLATITGGLDESAVVIVYPGDKVVDGTRVEPLPIASR